MTERRLVSVITPTWQRHDELAEAIANVREQTYRPIEHVIVVDGTDDEDSLDMLIAEQECMDRRLGARELLVNGRPPVPITFSLLGRNWSTFLPDSFCAAPITVGMLLASGAYQMWLADDERIAPDHIEGLVDALDAQSADFAYGRVRMYRAGQNPEDGYEIGHNPPSLGQITNVLYRVELLKHGLYPFGAGMTSDWACIQRWIMYGARYAFVGRCTLTHRADH